jgi:hypothetical protein
VRHGRGTPWRASDGFGRSLRIPNCRLSVLFEHFEHFEHGTMPIASPQFWCRTCWRLCSRASPRARDGRSPGQHRKFRGFPHGADGTGSGGRIEAQRVGGDVIDSPGRFSGITSYGPGIRTPFSINHNTPAGCESAPRFCRRNPCRHCGGCFRSRLASDGASAQAATVLIVMHQGASEDQTGAAMPAHFGCCAGYLSPIDSARARPQVGKSVLVGAQGISKS